MKVLVTGGLGYIGSHVVLELLNAGYQVVIVDNLANAQAITVQRLQELSGHKITWYQVDASQEEEMEPIFASEQFQGIVHLAAHKAVLESVQEPLKYYTNNLGSLLTCMRLAVRYQVQYLVFSSSATVYAGDQTMPVTETGALGPINPYGQTKFMAEQILGDVARAYPQLRVAILRYFNPIGAHASGLLGEDPKDLPNNLMPIIIQVASGQRQHLEVFGSDYPTPDGTCVRDYIHVVDLARGHQLALAYLQTHQENLTVNLGTGQGYSVLEVLHCFQKVNQVTVPYVMVGRRAGDVAQVYADPTNAERLLGFRCQQDLATMCRDSWNFYCQSGRRS